MSKKCHWFHCSETCHGAEWLARRMVPSLVRLTEEPKTPRLCVASSVARCFASRLFNQTVYVYRTETPRRSVKPHGVNDAVITQERWLIPPVRMVLTATIPAQVVRRACRHGIRVIREQMRRYEDPHLTVIDRLKTFREVVEVLGQEFADPIDAKFVNRALEYFEKKQVAA